MLANGILETSATTGTGTLTLAAAAGFTRFANGFANGARAGYAIRDGSNWEWGVGTVGAANTLARTTITATLVAGVYTTAGAVAITLSGIAEVINASHTGSATDLAQTLTDQITVTWDMVLGNIATLTLAGNRTFAAPTNMAVKTFILVVNQDATGSRLITWNAVFKWAAGSAPTLSTAAGAKDVFSFFCDGTNLYGSFLRGVA